MEGGRTEILQPVPPPMPMPMPMPAVGREGMAVAVVVEAMSMVEGCAPSV